MGRTTFESCIGRPRRATGLAKPSVGAGLGCLSRHQAERRFAVLTGANFRHDEEVNERSGAHCLE